MLETQILTRYAEVASASQRMLEAAREADWDGLVDAEKDCAALIERIRAMGGADALGPEARRERMSTIRKIIADDAEIRRLTQPWMQKLEAVLTGCDSERRLRNAYR